MRRDNHYNPMGLRRERNGQLVDRYGRLMTVDFDEFKKRRGKFKNPLVLSTKTAQQVADSLLS